MISNDQPIVNINQAKQVAYVVHDCEKTAERLFNLFGIGPWEVHIRDCNSTFDNEMLVDTMYHNKPCPFGFKLAETTLGPNGFSIELIQPLHGDDMFSDFLKEHGEGIHHFGWHVVNTQEEFDKVTSILEGQGFPCLQRARSYTSVLAYFDTTSALSVCLEVSFRDPTKKRSGPKYYIPKSYVPK